MVMGNDIWIIIEQGFGKIKCVCVRVRL